MVKAYVPERGDIIWLTLDPTAGHEQRGRRPVLVLTQKLFNSKHGLAFVVPITSKAKGYSDEVPFHTDHITGALLVAHARSIDWRARNVEFVTRIDNPTLFEVQEYLDVYLIKKV
jgi:mRNA interferase MazF